MFDLTGARKEGSNKLSSIERMIPCKYTVVVFSRDSLRPADQRRPAHGQRELYLLAGDMRHTPRLGFA